MLFAHGTTHIFMVPAVLRSTLFELEAVSGTIARIQTHGEIAAVYMADGYARAGARPGLCIAQSVGAMNLAAGLREAFLAHSPVIALSGGHFPSMRHRTAYQDVEDFSAYDCVTKWNARIDDVTRIADMMCQAFRVATTGCPGPVHIEFRGNEAQIELDVADIQVVTAPQFAAVPPYRPAANSDAIERAARLLERAHRPIILAGGGVVVSDASHDVVQLAERLSIPVACSLNGKSCIPAGNPLAVGVVGTYSRSCANMLMSEADLVLVIGSAMGGMTTHFWQLPLPGTPIIQIDIDPEALGRNYPVSEAILGDVRTAVRQLLEAVKLDDIGLRTQWLRRVGAATRSWYREFESLLASEAVPVRPERICRELSRNLPDNALVVVDTGHSGMWMGGLYDQRSPGQSYIRSAGHLGWALPASIGAKCAQPDRPVFAFIGDSGFWFHIAEVETAVRWRINTVTIINNNHSGNQMRNGFLRPYGDKGPGNSAEMWQLSKVNFAKIAEEMGALGIRVEHPDEIGPALLTAMAASRPAVIDIVTDIDAMAPLAWKPPKVNAEISH